MNIKFLSAFAHKISASGRISAADVAELRRHEDGEEHELDGLQIAEALLAIDAAAGDKSTEWSHYFVDAMVDILVWGERPTGVVTPAIADWLLSRMALNGGRATGTHQSLLVAVVREAQSCDPRIAAAAFGYDTPTADRAPVALTLGWLDSSGLTV